MTAESRFNFFSPKIHYFLPNGYFSPSIAEVKNAWSFTFTPPTAHSVIVKRMELLMFGKHTGILQYKWSGIQDLIV